jgi:hypothetical protein
MMHTVKVIAGGFLLLAVCLVVGRLIGGAGNSSILARSALVFIALWFIGAGINMRLGVTKAGYSVTEEIPFFFLVFLVPTAVALVIWWTFSRR